MLAVLFSENKGKFWSIDCHHLLICFLYIDLQPNSAAPRVQHSGPQTEQFSEKQRSSTIFCIISIVYMFYLRLHALLTLVRSFTLFGGWGGGGRGERGVGGRRIR